MLITGERQKLLGSLADSKYRVFVGVFLRFLQRVKERKGRFLNERDLSCHARTQVRKNHEGNGYPLPLEVKDVLFNSIIEQPKVTLFEASGNRTFVVEDNYGYLYEFNVCNDVRLCARLWMGQGSTPLDDQRANR